MPTAGILAESEAKKACFPKWEESGFRLVEFQAQAGEAFRSTGEHGAGGGFVRTEEKHVVGITEEEGRSRSEGEIERKKDGIGEQWGERTALGNAPISDHGAEGTGKWRAQ